MLKKIAKEFVYGGHLLSIGLASIVWTTIMLLGGKGGWSVIILSYLASQIVYNYDHLKTPGLKYTPKSNERTAHLVDTNKYQVLSLCIYAVLFVISLKFTTLKAALLISSIVVGGILYTMRAKKYTRTIVGFKTFYIALFASSLGFFVALHYSISLLNPVIILMVILMFTRFTINTAFCDIKDIKEDKERET